MNSIFQKMVRLKQKQNQRRLVKVLTAMNYGPGDNYKTSGEEQALEYIKEHIEARNPVIFDVGANVGGYTLMLEKNGMVKLKFIALNPRLKHSLDYKKTQEVLPT